MSKEGLAEVIKSREQTIRPDIAAIIESESPVIDSSHVCAYCGKDFVYPSQARMHERHCAKRPGAPRNGRPPKRVESDSERDARLAEMRRRVNKRPRDPAPQPQAAGLFDVAINKDAATADLIAFRDQITAILDSRLS